jgi:hypothetical protein
VLGLGLCGNGVVGLGLKWWLGLWCCGVVGLGLGLGLGLGFWGARLGYRVEVIGSGRGPGPG